MNASNAATMTAIALASDIAADDISQYAHMRWDEISSMSHVVRLDRPERRRWR